MPETNDTDTDWQTIFYDIKGVLAPVEAAIGPISPTMLRTELADKLRTSESPQVRLLVIAAEQVWPSDGCNQLATSMGLMATMREIARNTLDGK